MHIKCHLNWPRQCLGRPRGHRAFRGANTPNQRKIRSRGGVLGPFGGNPTKIGSFSSAAKFHYSLQYNCRPRGHRAFRGANTPNQRKIRSRGASWVPLGVTQRKSGALAAQPNSTTLYCGGPLRQPRIWAFFGLFCLFGPFRQKRRLFGRAATKTLV